MRNKVGSTSGKKSIGFKVKVKFAKILETGIAKYIAGQRDATLTIELDSIDVSDKLSEEAWDEVMAGFRSWNVACSGARVFGESSIDELIDVVIDEEHGPDLGKVVAFIERPDGKEYVGRILITSIAEASPQRDLVTYTIATQGDGPLKKVMTAPSAKGVCK